MKRLTILVLCLALVFGSCLPAAADGHFSHFLVMNEWNDDLFSDISVSDWFYNSVVSTYKMGLISGTDRGTFEPNAPVTIAETLKLACRLHSLFYTASYDGFDGSNPWYRSYVDYALEQGIISAEYADYSAPATRGQFAAILARALPGNMLSAINTVENGSIPDVPYSKPYAPAVYRLYRAGVFTGRGSDGAFQPDSNISRAEAVAVLGRMTGEDSRRSITLTAPAKPIMTGEELYATCVPAVFFLEVFNAKGELCSTGSGFFIDADGTAVTCWHVIDNAYSARVTVPGRSKSYEVLGLYDYNPMNDWAVIAIDGSGFSYLEIGDQKTVIGGTDIYALGSPLGLQSILTEGIICNPSTIEDLTNFITFSAPISNGSSGGALLNQYGEVIGITAASYIYAESLNLAVSITYIDNAVRDSFTPLAEIQTNLLEKLQSALDSV